ncbi:hypothetical protein SAMN02745121_08340 [Nannocystis exedens]|uniref:Uncharacterized protein n=1 Tax=Nannocystis exedens TaxID=54 RepID=A0A1I2I1G9_9BACT|nr:hypothetical protein [Nannocystis exedens]PCC73535.1 hypothetical protein NAEX_06623 [Nannocystis exedens]SFF35490.1 hypothetical protein SAMN02745121_08340 [Nannocystis exedens]
MDSLQRSLARLTRRPYRAVADETPLEVLVRQGPLPPVGRPNAPLIASVAIGSMLLLAPLILLSLAFGKPPWGALMLFGVCGVTGMWFRDGGYGGGLESLRARQAHYPLPLTGHVAHWLAGGELRFGGLDLVFRQQHPLAEATVRLTEPDAGMQWSSATTLRVRPRWGGGRLDFQRLDRLVLLLNIHRDELGLERIELVSA